MIPFVTGAIVMGCWVAGLFFLRFWMQTRDRLFLFFTAAFWVLALSWVALALTDETYEARPFLYLLRLVAFVLIIVGIVDKNRAKPPGHQPRDSGASGTSM